MLQARKTPVSGALAMTHSSGLIIRTASIRCGLFTLPAVDHRTHATGGGRPRCDAMSSPLQSKDDNWRSRPNGATPVSDPGLSPPGTDEEAGGAPAAPASSGSGPRPPLAATPGGSGGVVLGPVFWLAAGALVVLIFVVAAVLSF